MQQLMFTLFVSAAAGAYPMGLPLRAALAVLFVQFVCRFVCAEITRSATGYEIVAPATNVAGNLTVKPAAGGAAMDVFSSITLLQQLLAGGMVIATPTVLNVGATRAFQSIVAAWQSLTGKVLAAPVTIRVDPGTYTMASGFIFTHPFASQISILGDLAQPSNVVLNQGPPPSDVLFQFSGSQSIGTTLGGFTLNAATPGGGYAILVNNYAQLTVANSPAANGNGQTIIINNFAVGVNVGAASGTVLSGSGVATHGCTYGIIVDFASTCVLPYSHLDGSGAVVAAPALSVTRGGVADVTLSTISNYATALACQTANNWVTFAGTTGVGAVTALCNTPVQFSR